MPRLGTPAHNRVPLISASPALSPTDDHMTVRIPPRDPSLHLEILKFVTDAQSFSLSKVTYSQVLGVRMWTSCGGGGH